MRRRRSRTVAALLGALLSVHAASTAEAQAAEDGALFLLLPVGARAVGMGQAVAADQGGSEAVWWNPAGIARTEKPEAAIHHSQSVIGTGDAVTVVVPSSLLGVLALSVNILNFGEQDVTDVDVGTVGTILPRSFVYAATYGTPIGDHISAGLSYKVVQFRVDCSGACPQGSNFAATSSALDFGAQFNLGDLVPATIGVALRNVGPRLQVNDNPQSDPLPTRLQIGALYRVGLLERYAKGTELHLTGDVLDQVRLSAPSTRFGADVVWQKKIHARVGYVFDSSESGGPSVGLGLTAGSLVIDIARLFEGLSSAAGQAPTYLSLRYVF
ncbi:MAG: PorV/PorQ family protein [Gemmatimonadaceae bacterium]